VVQTQCNQYTVTHDADGGDCDDSTLVYYDANVDGPTSCSKTDYDLTGYTLVSGTCNTSFNSTTGDCYGVRSDVTIEAEWTLSNSVPNPPQSPLTDGLVNPSDLQNITPEFSAIYDDDDLDDTSSYYEVEVNTASDFSGTVMWDSGKQSMTQTNEGARSPNITYNGTTLTYNGQTYYWRIKFWDAADASSDWSTANFTMDIPTSSYYEIEVNTSSDFTGTVMWDSGKTAMTETTAGQRSPTLTYNGDPLAGGVTYYWRIRFWDMNDSVSDWSDPAQFEINRTPTAPTVLLTEGETNPIKVYDTTPEFSAIYNDSDTGDTAGYYQIQVNTQNDFNGTSMWDSTKTAMTSTSAGTRSPDISYAGTTLSESTTYYWRIKFWDSNDHESPWSSTASFIMSGPPTASNLQIIGTTSPTQVLFDIYFSALYTDPNSDDSTNYEIEVNTASDFTGTVMWDSNKTSATISSGNRSSDIYYDGTTLNYDGTTYYVRMRFWDTDDNVSDWTTDQFTDTLKSFRFNGLQMGGVQLN
jgi:hypothetical protein